MMIAQASYTPFKITILGESRLSRKFAEKQNQYVDLKTEFSQLWYSKVYILPFISGALGYIPKTLPYML